jgi:hypothetical protein
MTNLLARFAPLAIALVGFGAPATASAATIEDGYLGDLEILPLTVTDLDELRGGFMTPLGFEVGFGASITSTVDGALALRTEFNWTDAGITKTVTNANGPASDVLDMSAASAGGIDLAGAGNNLTGVVVPGDPGKGGGATAIIQGFDLSGLSTAIINTASQRTVQTDTQVNIDLPAAQLDSMAAQKAAAGLSSSLAQALAFGGL